MTRFPILLSSDFSPAMVLHPLAFRLTEKLTPLSTATITLPDTAAEQVPLRSFVRLTSPQGEAGVYRVVSRTTNAGLTTELSLQHGLCSLSDHMHPGESEETSPCRVLLEKLLENQDTWVIGTVDVPDEEPLTWKCSNTNDLQGLTDIMKELPGYYLDFSQDTLPWVLHVRKKPESISCEARFDRNIMDAQIAYDTYEMCNIAYAKGLEEPITADTVDTWGPIARNVSADDDLPQEVLVQTVERYLEQKKNPQVTITLTALALSRITGEPFDSFRIGMLCRCILPEMTTVQRIEAIDWKDPLGVPSDVVLTLSSTQKDMSATVTGLVVDTRVRFDRMQKKLRLEAEQIEMLAKEILLRATQAEVDGLGYRVSLAEIAIDGINARIDLKAEKSFVDELSTRLSQAEIDIDGANARIDLKASQSLVDELSSRLSQAEINIDGANARIDLKASQKAVDELSTRLSQAEINIDGANARIDLKASQKVVDALGERLSAAEINIDGANARIDLKASQEVVDDLSTRLSQAEIDIDGANAAILLKASQTTVDELGEKVTAAELRIDGAESKITAQAKTLEAKADLILLDGYVKAADLETKVLNVLSYAKISTLSAGSLYADTAALDWLSVNGSTVKTATLTIGEKTATIFAPFDATFELSDMPGYDDALAAARTEGASSVYVSDIDLYDVQYGKTTKTISASLDVILSTNATSQHSISLDASAAYSAGEKDGANTLSLSPSTSTTLDYGASQTVTATTSYGSTTVTKTVTLTAPADRYGDGLLLGMKAFKTTSVSVSGTLSDDYNYTLDVTCTNETGANSWTFSVPFSAKEAYDKGFQAGKAAMGLVRDGNTVSVGESETKSMIYTLHDTHRLSHGGTVNLVPGDRYTGSNAGTFYFNAQVIGTSYVSWD